MSFLLVEGICYQWKC